ncbi:MAG TPA: COX15/CtaA family protein [Cyclobacteriaceae bacterium]|nr:COX15/CtaA family protein [Cyclobacteriaceae bacterium]
MQYPIPNTQAPTPNALKSFHKLCLSTLIAVYILILVGAVVRSTGSGMGCPDWPRCFGNFIPPTSVDQLPADYKEKYAAIREKKNIKFAKYLSAFGFKDTAEKILNDKSILVEADFNPVKTWIEYINRLTGVVIGFLIIALTWRSFKLRKEQPVLFRISLITLIGVIFQGWFGSIVVSTNLTTWTITLHMFLALVIVLLLVYLQHRSEPVHATGMSVFLPLAAIVLLFVQVFLGTEVRSAIDMVSSSLPRSGWLESVGRPFITHRTFSWIVLAIQAVLIVKIQKTGGAKSLSLPLIILILGTFLTGVGMAYLDVPAVLQPLHLLLATMAIGTEALLMFRITNGSSSSSISGI